MPRRVFMPDVVPEQYAGTALCKSLILLLLLTPCGCGFRSGSETSSQTGGAQASTSDSSEDDSDSELTAPEQAGSTQAKLTPQELVAATDQAVVKIECISIKGLSIASGFVVDPAGLVVTNYHVMSNAAQATAHFQSGKTAKVNGIRWKDASRDIAVIEIAAQDLPALTLAEAPPAKGEDVFAFGNPHGIRSMSKGIVSAILRADQLPSRDRTFQGTWIQTDAAISPGNSGGPLVNRSGQVVGANAFGIVNGQNLNFAISAGDIANVLNEAKAAKLVEFSKFPFNLEITNKVIAVAGPNVPELAGQLEPWGKQRRERLEKIKELEKQYHAVLERLKSAEVAVDAEAERTVREELLVLKASLQKVTEESFAGPDLSLTTLKVGDVGYLRGKRVYVSKIDKEAGGICLVLPLGAHVKNCDCVQMRGLKLDGVQEQQTLTLGENYVFRVAGKVKYIHQVSGKTHEFFDLKVALNVDEVRDWLNTQRGQLPERLPLSPDEQEQQKLAQRQKEQELQEARRKEQEEQKKRARLARMEEAKRELSYAANLSEHGKYSAAERRLKKIIQTYPNTPPAKDAEKLLNEIRKLLKNSR